MTPFRGDALCMFVADNISECLRNLPWVGTICYMEAVLEQWSLPMHVLVHRCSETWAMSGWGIYENPAPAAQHLLLVFWEAMASTCNMLIAYHLRNIKVRFRIKLRLELGTIVDVVFRERAVSATKILLKIHTCILHIDNGYSPFPYFLVIRYATDWSRHYLCICKLLHELHVWTLRIGYVERCSCIVSVILSAHRKLNGRVWVCV